MYMAKSLAILLLVGLSTQNTLRFPTLFDINDLGVSKQCSDAMTEKTQEVNTCANNVALKYQAKIGSDIGNVEQLTKDVCALIKEEEEQCVTLVKGPCTDAEIEQLDKLIEIALEQQLKQALGVDIKC